MKLDCTLLLYLSVMWFLFGINRASYSTAYISGMKEAVGFAGKEFNYMETIFLVFYVVFQVPCMVLLTLVRPRYVFVTANVLWSILTLATYRVDHVWQVFMLNGVEGACMALAYVGAHFTYGAWYTESELGTRAAIFCGFGNLGNMAGGWIQAGLLASLSGGPLPPWRLIFIVVAAMAFPLALIGWFFIPDLPHHRSAWFLSAEEQEYAIRRMGKAQEHTWDRTVFRRVLLSWQFWLLPTIFMLFALCIQCLGNNVIPLWMASRGYSVIQQNNYPTARYAVAIVATLVYTIVSDRLKSRWGCSLCIGFTFVVGSAILVAHPASDAAYFFAFFLLGTTYAPQALWYSWAADLTAHDVQLRALTTGFMNSFDFVFVSWWAIVFYPVTDAPEYPRGFVASLVTGALTIPIIALIAYLERRGRQIGTIGRMLDDAEGPGKAEGQCGDAKETKAAACPPSN
ncbi:uncharacterized protein UV8b_05546 [Ustilaginoidea virens]|uniref:Pantothenate transporter n=1 Tax=Ustilaginoidea virens TaxID=1159556 RepID=A0A8E5MI78_USTVR|nr:uncharacterized protein UV8b_05546 [Ustilaginoidea virens]QUC21303.1 hypothetical protein UV8b_05546 [Ustilaginoidea virens]